MTKINTFLCKFGLVCLFVLNYLSFQKQLQMQSYSPSSLLTAILLAANCSSSEMQE